jgi:4'-phosphopantetheinyl transferase
MELVSWLHRLEWRENLRFWGDWLMKPIDASSKDSILKSLAAAIVWAKPPAHGISIAAFSDHDALDESALLVLMAAHERDRAATIDDPAEKRHYILRRCFQRVFLKSVLDWPDDTSELALEHRLDTQPRCLDAPNVRLSFSSSGTTALACASKMHTVGIDIEKRRPIQSVAALALRFFTPNEAAFIAALPLVDQELAFLKHWTAKEAGLKAIGKGIVSGLNSFVLEPKGSTYSIDVIDEFKTKTPWILNYVNSVPDYIVAVVHNLEK